MLRAALPLLLLLGLARPCGGEEAAAEAPTPPEPAAADADARTEPDPEFIKKVNSLVEAGAASLKAHKVYDAIESLAEAVELAPGFWRGHFLLGIARVTEPHPPHTQARAGTFWERR